MERFTGKVAIVTGAASGIGAGIARRLSREGAKVTLVDRNADALHAVAAALPAHRTMAIVADVSDSRAVDDFVQTTVSHRGQLDVMVNNAGIYAAGKPEDITDEQWHEVLRTDLDGVFFGCRAAIPHLEKTHGSIINTASVSGLAGDWGMSPYNAAKGGVVNLTRSLALDLGRRGVRVNAVCPSLTRTGMTAEMMDDPELLGSFIQRMPLGRVAEPDDIAGVVAFLASDDARFVTGANIPVDGGVMASNGQPPQG